MKLTRGFAAILLCLALILTTVGCSNKKDAEQDGISKPAGTSAADKSDKLAACFDQNNIVFSFGAISDIHLDGGYMEESSYEKSTTAFRVLQELAGNKLDAVLIAGDLVNCTNSPNNVFYGSDKYPGTKEENYPIQSAREKENFKKAVADALPDSIPLFYCLGNHDSMNNNHVLEFIDAFSGKNNETFDRYYQYDIDFEQTKQGKRHAVIGGYHFLGIDLSNGGYSQDSLLWLRGEIEKIVEKDKNQSIFLACHYSPQFAGAMSKGGETLDDILKDYPQVITFYGHDHNFIQLETSIMQDDSGYITLDCGSANYFPLEAAAPEMECINVNKGYVEQNYGGYLVQIDKEGDIRVRRINFKNGAPCADDWYIPAIKNGKRDLHYTMARKQKVEKPYFEKNAKLDASSDKYRFGLSFPAAICEDYIYYYKVTVTEQESGKKVSEFGVSSRLFSDVSKKDGLKQFDVYTSPLKAGKYTVTVTPYDTFENAGEPLKSQIKVQ